MKLGKTVILFAALALASGQAGAGLRSSKPGGSPGGLSHPYHHRFHGSFFIGAPVFFSPWAYGYYYPPYYYGPDYRPQYEAPSVYVEKFEGTPTRDTPGHIYCPSRDAYYPEVEDCPGGWQRVIR